VIGSTLVRAVHAVDVKFMHTFSSIGFPLLVLSVLRDQYFKSIRAGLALAL
jgi:hypothetical protein